MEEEVKIKKDWKPIIIYLLFNVVFPFVVSFPLGILSVKKAWNLDFQNIAYIMAFLAALLNFIAFGLMYKNLIKDSIKNSNKNTAIKVIVISLIIILLNYIICDLFEKYGVNMENQEIIENMFSTFPILSSISILLSPLIEELLFRYSLKTIIKNDVVFVIISSLTFGMLHGLGIATILYVLIGAFLSIIYLKTNKNILMPILAHFLNNLIGLITMFI